jgi:tetracycline resistance monooxygenase
MDFKNKIKISSFLSDDLLPNWNESYKNLFKATDTFTLLPMRKMPLDKPWETKGNITLIGDAAYVMPPFFAGIGVNIGFTGCLVFV